MLRATALAITLALTAAPAFAQSATPDTENGRYVFKQMDKEILRLDGRTGQVSLCAKREAGWSCLAVPDERSALETEITRLQAEGAALKKELVARGIPLPVGTSRPRGKEPGSNEIVIKLPSDADLDKVVTLMERAWRRLQGTIRRDGGS